MASFTEFPIPRINIDDYVAQAQEWAANPEDDAVTGGGGLYSALHYAAKAQATAETLASLATLENLVTSAEAAQTAAETARDNAFINAHVYPSTGAGLAATSLDGQFQVVTGYIATRYRHDSGPTANAVASYPALGLMGYHAIPCSVGGTVNAIEITPLTGLSGVAAVSQYSFTPAGANTLAPSINIVGVIGEQRAMRFPGGSTVPAGYLRTDTRYTVYYDGVTGWPTIISPLPHYLENLPLKDSGSSTATSLSLIPSIPHSVPSSSATTYTFIALADRGTGELPGMTATINGSELRQLRHPDGSQIEAETWEAGDVLVIGEYDADVGGFVLLSPGKPSDASARSLTDFFSLRTNQIAAIAALQ